MIENNNFNEQQLTEVTGGYGLAKLHDEAAYHLELCLKYYNELFTLEDKEQYIDVKRLGYFLECAFSTDDYSERIKFVDCAMIVVDLLFDLRNPSFSAALKIIKQRLLKVQEIIGKPEE